MKRIYISGKITNNPHYFKEFMAAERHLIRKGYDSIVNPARIGLQFPADYSHPDYMKVCLAALETCEAIYLLSNYKNSIGALLEERKALQLGLKTIYQEEEE